MVGDGLKIGKNEWNKIKDGLLSGTLKKRGYVFDKRVTLAPFIIGIILLFIVYAQEGFDNNVYIVCPEENVLGCSNPYKEGCNPIMESCVPEPARTDYCKLHPDLCIMQQLPPGFTYGRQPGWLYNNYFMILFTCILFFYTLNHVLFNKKSQREDRKCKLR